MKYEELIIEAADKLNCKPEHIKLYSWYQMFSSTAGPRTGVIAGHAFTEFQILGFENKYTNETVKYCSGIWKEWSGTLGDKW